jgi:HAD superfamily hydrolase (TIGR01509 family)
MIELVMFDADGVLFDSDESNVAYYNWIFAQVGEPPLDRNEEISAISYAASEVFAARARGDAVKLRRMQELTRGMDQTPFFKMLRPPFELRPFMLDLKQRHKLALATNRSATVPALIEHLDLAGVFDAVASALDKVNPKPAPDILNLCLKRANVAASRAVYVGDSKIDRVAAESAGMHFIAVGRRVDHHHRIPTLADLHPALKKLIASLA